MIRNINVLVLDIFLHVSTLQLAMFSSVFKQTQHNPELAKPIHARFYKIIY